MFTVTFGHPFCKKTEPAYQLLLSSSLYKYFQGSSWVETRKRKFQRTEYLNHIGLWKSRQRQQNRKISREELFIGQIMAGQILQVLSESVNSLNSTTFWKLPNQFHLSKTMKFDGLTGKSTSVFSVYSKKTFDKTSLETIQWVAYKNFFLQVQ